MSATAAGFVGSVHPSSPSSSSLPGPARPETPPQIRSRAGSLDAAAFTSDGDQASLVLSESTVSWINAPVEGKSRPAPIPLSPQPKRIPPPLDSKLMASRPPVEAALHPVTWSARHTVPKVNPFQAEPLLALLSAAPVSNPALFETGKGGLNFTLIAQALRPGTLAHIAASVVAAYAGRTVGAGAGESKHATGDADDPIRLFMVDRELRATGGRSVPVATSDFPDAGVSLANGTLFPQPAGLLNWCQDASVKGRYGRGTVDGLGGHTPREEPIVRDAVCATAVFGVAMLDMVGETQKKPGAYLRERWAEFVRLLDAAVWATTDGDTLGRAPEASALLVGDYPDGQAFISAGDGRARLVLKSSSWSSCCGSGEGLHRVESFASPQPRDRGFGGLSLEASDMGFRLVPPGRLHCAVIGTDGALRSEGDLLDIVPGTVAIGSHAVAAEKLVELPLTEKREQLVSTLAGAVEKRPPIPLGYATHVFKQSTEHVEALDLAHALCDFVAKPAPETLAKVRSLPPGILASAVELAIRVRTRDACEKASRIEASAKQVQAILALPTAEGAKVLERLGSLARAHGRDPYWKVQTAELLSAVGTLPSDPRASDALLREALGFVVDTHQTLSVDIVVDAAASIAQLNSAQVQAARLLGEQDARGPMARMDAYDDFALMVVTPVNDGRKAASF